MKLLFLTFYYEPDLSAGSFRSKALIQALIKRMGKNDTIEVLTTLPNRYASFKETVVDADLPEMLSIVRFKIPEHKSGMFDQALSYLRYYIHAGRYVRKKDYDIVFATSSRLLTAYLGAVIAKKKDIPLVIDIRDIFTDNLSSILKNRFSRSIIKVFSIIEKKTVFRATKINLVSVGFEDYFRRIRPDVSYSFITNGIDSEFLEYNFEKTERTDKTVITYAGNIGQGQGLEKIIPEFAQALGENYLLRIIGDGGMRYALEKKLQELQIKNVQIIDPVKRNKLLLYYKESDFLFLHLNNLKAFNKVLPSKIFEYAATGKPVIAGVSGYAEIFIKKNLDSGWLVFRPTEISDLITKFKEFKPVIGPKNIFYEKYARTNLMSKFAEIIIDTYSSNL